MQNTNTNMNTEQQQTDAGDAPQEMIKQLLEHAKDDLRLAEITASQNSLWHVADAAKLAHNQALIALMRIKD